MVKKKTKPYFYINGYNFNVGTDAKSNSDITLIKNKMFTPQDSYGYTDIKFINFHGSTIDLSIYSRITDIYTGDEAQPSKGGINDFYMTQRTPHAVLKYWAENGVPCTIKTDLQAFEDGRYMIDETFSQINLSYDFIETTLTLIQAETPTEMNQTYYSPTQKNNKDTSIMSAQAIEIQNLGSHTQKCSCTETTNNTECTAKRDPEVLTIQKYLQMWGYFPSYTHKTKQITINGKYCYHTTQAIMNFQKDNNITVNGDFTEETKDKFLRVITGE